MDSLTKNEIAEVTSNIEKCNSLKQIFPPNWISGIISPNQERMKVHPLVWFLLEKDKSHRLDIWLRTLEQSFPKSNMGKFSKIINKLKKATTDEKFYSILSEIEVGSFYAKEFPIEYEPNVGVDWKITMEDQQVFLQVKRLFLSRDLSLAGRSNIFPPQIEFIPIDTAGRLKKIIMDKAEKLPAGQLCIVACNVSRISFAYPYHVEDASLGQRVLIQNGSNQNYARLANGAFCARYGDRVSAVFAFEDFKYKSKSMIPNKLNAKFPLPSNIKEKL